MGILDHLTCLLRNLYAGQEAIVRTLHGTKDWFKMGKAVHQSCILSLCLFNLHAEYIMWNARLDESQTGITIAERNINTLRYAGDTTVMAESEEELKSLSMKVKEESEKAGLKLNIQKMKIMASSPIPLWQIEGETVETVTDLFWASKITADGDCSHGINRRLLLGTEYLCPPRIHMLKPESPMGCYLELKLLEVSLEVSLDEVWRVEFPWWDQGSQKMMGRPDLLSPSEDRAGRLQSVNQDKPAQRTGPSWHPIWDIQNCGSGNGTPHWYSCLENPMDGGAW